MTRQKNSSDAMVDHKDFVVQKRKYEELRECLRALSPTRSCLVVSGPSGCGKKLSIEKASADLCLDMSFVPDFAMTKLASYILQLSFKLRSEDPPDALLVIPDADMVSSADEWKAFKSWLQGNPQISPIKGVVLVTGESRQADTLIEILRPMSAQIKFRPITTLCMKKLLKTADPFLDSDTIEDLAVTSGGDARFALNALQGARAAVVGKKRRRNGPAQSPKDVEITFFHAVARTLHAKNETFEPGNILALPCVADNFGIFNLFIIENACDFSKDISSLGKFLEISSFADTLPAEDMRSAVLVYGWAAGGPGNFNRGFNELRKPRLLEENSRRAKNLNFMNILMRGNRCYNRFWYMHRMLEISKGRYPQLPSFVLSAMHAMASGKEPGSIPETLNFQVEKEVLVDEIEECF